MTVTAVTPAILGRTEPRIWTPPLRPLSPATSYGYAVAAFARDVLGQPLDPWQEWLVIHAGEMLEDGRPRFRTVLVLVARQAGKTHLCTVLALFWMFVEKWPLTLGMSTMLEYARESWEAARVLAEDTDELAAQVPRNWVKEGNNDVRLLTSHGTRYKIAAATRRGGRSLRIDRLIIDELREHSTWQAWNASTNAMTARPRGQAWCITNQGDESAVVLESLRKSALSYLDGGEGDARLGIFEWSGPDGCELDDVEALAQANPNVGRRTHWDDLLGPARRAKAAGGEEESGFRTEVLCQRVRLLDPALDPRAWAACLDRGDLNDPQLRVALCLDLSPDGQHATLAAAAVLPDGRVRVEALTEWVGASADSAAERALPGWVERVRSQAVGWFPTGPAAAIAARLADRRKDGVQGWPPRRVTVAEIRGEVAAVCMGLNKEIVAGTLAHSGQAGLDAQVAAAEWLRRGDTKVFTRRGDGPVDAVYAMAGAVHLARTLPTRRVVSRRVHGA